MAQRLMADMKDEAGNDTTKIVSVIRSWNMVGCPQVFLHTNGVYGYKDGAPVREEKEFDVIASPLQRKAALGWWNRVGRDLSRRYYEAQDARLARLAGDHNPDEGAPDSAKDAALYQRSGKGDGAGVEGPFSWMDLFATRPEWWGPARKVEFAEYVYERVEEEQVTSSEPRVTGKKK